MQPCWPHRLAACWFASKQKGPDGAILRGAAGRQAQSSCAVEAGHHPETRCPKSSLPAAAADCPVRALSLQGLPPFSVGIPNIPRRPTLFPVTAKSRSSSLVLQLTCFHGDLVQQMMLYINYRHNTLCQHKQINTNNNQQGSAS